MIALVERLKSIFLLLHKLLARFRPVEKGDWDAFPVEPLESPNTNIPQRGKKLKARRSKKNSNPVHEDQPPLSEFHFMPTPGIGQPNTSVFENNGPAVDDTVS
ncbi:Uncharacterized protein Fot_06837 [Forsythia ovata]|uniref:Uncharacterized protein n=1 Tax=Forsythia ovata TaxID=205694 RepID=A0ABD1WX02_9LAMI